MWKFEPIPVRAIELPGGHGIYNLKSLQYIEILM